MGYIAQISWLGSSSAGTSGGSKTFDEKPNCYPFENKEQPVPMDAHNALRAIDHLHATMAVEIP